MIGVLFFYRSYHDNDDCVRRCTYDNNMVGAMQSMMPWPMMDLGREMLNDGDSPIATYGFGHVIWESSGGARVECECIQRQKREPNTTCASNGSMVLRRRTTLPFAVEITYTLVQRTEVPYDKQVLAGKPFVSASAHAVRSSGTTPCDARTVCAHKRWGA